MSGTLSYGAAALHELRVRARSALDPMREFSITTNIAATAERVWEVMSHTDRWHEWTPSVTSVPRLRVVAHHLIEPTISGSRATLSLSLQGVFGGLFGRMTKGITRRYLACEAKGLKARSENPEFRHGGTRS
jgi:hypothetical protein